MKVRKLINNNDGTYSVILTKGQFAIIDAEDAPYVGEYNWHATPEPSTGSFYARRGINVGKKKTKTILMHRDILRCQSCFQVDHKNHNSLDNRRNNLSIVTQNQNQHNQKPRSHGSSKYKGVSLDKRHKTWVSYIMLNNTRIHIGSYASEVEAAYMYDQYARELFKEYRYLNFEE